MIYQSNLIAPELSHRFRLKDPPLITLGHDMPSDPDYEPNCGFFTHDEAAILFHCAARIGGRWIDIGSRFGWTTAHLIAAGAEDVYAIDPAYADYDLIERAFIGCPQMIPVPLTSEAFFRNYKHRSSFSGVVIDGNHDSPEPFKDAINSSLLGPDVIVFHDFRGKPIRDGVNALLDLGWHARAYDTPNGVAVCWRCEEFEPPLHVPDPAIDWAQIRAGNKDFDYARCS